VVAQPFRIALAQRLAVYPEVPLVRQPAAGRIAVQKVVVGAWIGRVPGPGRIADHHADPLILLDPAGLPRLVRQGVEVGEGRLLRLLAVQRVGQVEADALGLTWSLIDLS